MKRGWASIRSFVSLACQSVGHKFNNQTRSPSLKKRGDSDFGRDLLEQRAKSKEQETNMHLCCWNHSHGRWRILNFELGA